MTAETILLQLQLVGDNAAVQGLNRVDKAVDSTTDKASKLGGGFSAAEAPILRFLATASLLSDTLTQIGSLVSNMTGIGSASMLMQIEAQLTTVTGSAEKAKRILKDVRDLSLKTAYSPIQVGSFASQLLNAGTPENRLKGEAGSVLNLAALGNVLPVDMPLFMRNLINIRGRPVPERQDLYEMTQRGFPLARIIAAGTGDRRVQTSEQAIAKIQQLGGEKAYQALIKGADAINKNAAAMQLLLSPLAMAQNLFENLAMVMAPTGRLLLTVLMPMGLMGSKLAEMAIRFNESTGGVGGLTLLIVALSKGWSLVTGTIQFAVSETQKLTAALTAYSSAAQRAAGMSAVNTGAEVAKGAAGAGLLATLGLFSRRASTAYGLAGTRGVLGFMASGLAPTASKIGGFLKGGGWALPAALISTVAGESLQNSTDPGKQRWGAFLSDAGTFGGGGALLGSLFGGAGGAAIGFGIGAGIAAVKNLFFASGGAMDETAKNTAQMARSLSNIEQRAMGGGERFQAFRTLYDIEQYRLSQTSIVTGVI